MLSPGICQFGKAKQRGAALMIILSVLVVGFAAVLVGTLSYSALNSARQERTSAVLAQAKDALLGRAATDSNMPGSLPCPDLITDIAGTNVPDDGIADLLAGNDCPSYIGRLPWRTLGLPDLRDGNGERLWYALSSNFRDDNSAQPLNSNTKGTLLVYDTNGTSQLTQAGYSAVAVIFSPGSPVGPQTRKTVAERNSEVNYLDAANGRDNAISGGPFIAGTQSDTFNDRLLFITTKDLMPLVEQRIAGVVKKALDDYFADNSYYPWADLISASPTYDADIGLNRGWLPSIAATGGTYPTPNWRTIPSMSPPQWFFDNQWYTLIYYSVARDLSRNPGSCSSCIDSTLSVNGVNGGRVLFIMPGTPIGTLTRTIDNLSDYLEDPQNKDLANDIYVTSASQGRDRDRVYWLTLLSAWKP